MDYGIISLLPPLAAIVLAIWTRQVYLSLMLGVWIGWMILSGGNLIDGSLASIQGLVDVFKDAGNTRTIMFGALVGGLITFIQYSGGVEGFINYTQQKIKKYEADSKGKHEKMIQTLTWLIGLLIFVESSISVLTVGSLFRPIYDSHRMPREKLAYLADTSSAPSCILIPLNAWGAFIMGLLLTEGITNPFHLMISSIPYNFYALFSLAFALFIIWFDWDFKAMRKAEERVKKEGKLLPDGAQPMISEDLTDLATKPGVKPQAKNMLLPILTMILMMPIMLIYTGWPAAIAALGQDAGFGDLAFFAIGQGSGSTSVLISVIVALLLSSLSYGIQGIFTLKETMDLLMKGIQGMMPLALLMLFAFAISAVCKNLGTGLYVAQIAEGAVNPGLVPMLLFLVSGFIAFSTGTSWGTFAIMIPIAMPLSAALGVPVELTLAAALGGGVFGDHCSPISDTTIISSMASACDHVDHVRTQLPYALSMAGAAIVMYLALGFAMT